MRLILIRHGEPDAVTRRLTEKGRREADLLRDRVLNWKNIRAIYTSPLARAVETAEPSLRALGRTAEELSWLQEFDHPVVFTNGKPSSVAWDMSSDLLAEEPDYYDPDRFLDTPLFRSQPEIAAHYAAMRNGLDSLLASYGYHHEAGTTMFRLDENALGDDDDNLVFFCHFGAISFMLGYLSGISPVTLLHHFVILPTGITAINAEKDGDASAHFRVQFYGDTSHLREGGEPLSQHAAFSPLMQG